jgi:hypothetical protein
VTQPLTSNPSNGLPELIEGVKTSVEATVANTEALNRDLLALTVEVETLRETMAETVSEPESEYRRKGTCSRFCGKYFCRRTSNGLACRNL